MTGLLIYPGFDCAVIPSKRVGWGFKVAVAPRSEGVL